MPRDQPAGRVPPHNIAAEESVLGAMLLNRDAIADADEHLDPADFYKPAHGHVYDAITSLHARGEPADGVTVADELRRNGLLDAIGGPSVLTSLQHATPSTSNVASYAHIVEEHALLRRLIGVAGEIAELGYSVPEDVEAVIDRAESLVFEVGDRRQTDETKILSELIYGSLERIEQIVANGVPATITIGLPDYDRITGGYAHGSLNVIAGRPGMGKTSLAVHVALNAAVNNGRPTLFLSAEMSHEEITDRVLSNASGVSSETMRSGKLTESDWPRLSNGTSSVGDAPLFIRSTGSPTIAGLRAQVRRLAARLGVTPLVIVDYIQLFTGARHTENRQAEVSEYARGLKRIAVDLHTEIVACAQVNRGVEVRGDKRPGLSDLRESGEIEAAADTVTFIYRDEYYNPETTQPGIAELILAKNRHGPTGLAPIRYTPETGRWFGIRREEQF